MTKEIWKDIPSYEDCYQASNLGRIRSFKCELKAHLAYQNKLKKSTNEG